MRNTFVLLAIIAVGFGMLRRVSDGPNGEVIAALMLVAATVLFVGAAVLDRIDRGYRRAGGGE